MKNFDRYIYKVLRNIQAPPHERERIEADLRMHLEDALGHRAANEPIEAIIERMGSPQQVAAEFMADVSLNYAGFWPRLLAFFIDIALCLGVTLPLSAIAIVISNQIPERDPQGAEALLGAILIFMFFGIIAVIAGLFLLYFPILEGRFGQTVGKRLLGLRVITESGAAIGFKQAFLRRLSFYFEIFPVDVLFIPFTEHKQRAFDILARTVVIREPR